MVCDRRKFPKAEMLPLTREEMISLLKGNGTQVDAGTTH